VIERGFVIMCRRYGFHLELYGFEASRFEGGAKSTLRVIIIFLVLRSHKMNRLSDYCRPDLDPKLVFRLFAQVPENPCDQILRRMPSTEGLRAVKVATSQKRFERLDQATLRVRREICSIPSGPVHDFRVFTPRSFAC
jgi:hypothetical protein